MNIPVQPLQMVPTFTVVQPLLLVRMNIPVQPLQMVPTLTVVQLVGVEHTLIVVQPLLLVLTHILIQLITQLVMLRGIILHSIDQNLQLPQLVVQGYMDTH
jgi:hypothetical protein